MKTERIIFHVDMNAFFASVEQQFNPSLRGKPIAVCGNPKSRTTVAACSYEAKAYGVRNGSSIREAKSLCPPLILVGGNPYKYITVSQEIFGSLIEYSPQVELFSIDEAFMDVTQTLHRFANTPQQLARRIKARIRSRYDWLTCSIGIGPNKLIAKLASDLQKPDGLVVIESADIPLLMQQLPVDALCGIGSRLRERLNLMGIVNGRDLGEASETFLIGKFGVMGSVLKRMGQGRDAAPVAFYHAESAMQSMGHSYTLPRDTGDPVIIFGTLLRLSEKVGRRLRLGGYQGRTVALTVRYSGMETVTRHKALPVFIDSGFELYRQAKQLFYRHCYPLRRKVRLVGVGLSQLTREHQPASLLDAGRRQQSIERCLDRMADRYGECTVVRASALRPLVMKSHGFLLKHARKTYERVLE